MEYLYLTYFFDKSRLAMRKKGSQLSLWLPASGLKAMQVYCFYRSFWLQLPLHPALEFGESTSLLKYLEWFFPFFVSKSAWGLGELRFWRGPRGHGGVLFSLGFGESLQF